MMERDFPKAGPGRPPRRRFRPTSIVVVVAALSLLAVGATACSSAAPGNGVASIGSTTTSASSSGTHEKASMLAFSQCMRAHGIGDFPDPNSQGQIQIQAGPGSDLNQNNPQFKAAQQACKDLMPTPSPSQQARMKQQMLAFAQCMRAHGIADFPDPSAQGGIMIHGGSGTDLNPNNPQFQAAQQACQKNLPGGKAPTTKTGGPGGGSGGQGSVGFGA